MLTGSLAAAAAAPPPLLAHALAHPSLPACAVSVLAPAPSARWLLRAAVLAAGWVAAAPCTSAWPLSRAQCSAAADEGHTSPASAAPQPSYSLLRIAGDGRCLFRSLAQGAHLAQQADEGGERPQLLAAAQETARADELRSAICEELLARR